MHVDRLLIYDLEMCQNNIHQAGEQWENCSKNMRGIYLRNMPQDPDGKQAKTESDLTEKVKMGKKY